MRTLGRHDPALQGPFANFDFVNSLAIRGVHINLRVA
jgi:hypothetical protein